MEMVSIPKSDYSEFLNWKAANGGTVIPPAGKDPEGGWKYYRPGVNPWAKETYNSSAQMEVASRDLDLAIRLVECLPNSRDWLPTLKEMKKRELLASNGF